MTILLIIVFIIYLLGVVASLAEMYFWNQFNKDIPDNMSYMKDEKSIGDTIVDIISSICLSWVCYFIDKEHHDKILKNLK